jgi:cytochrome c oxidase subunit 1/cytochrome c oxidase subunit I+III
MGAMAIMLLGTFNGLLAQTLPVRLPTDSSAPAFARLQYLFLGVGVFVLGALGHLREAPAGHADDWRSKIGFWLMFLGFNLAFFPTTLRRSQALLTNPTRLLSASVGPEVVLGAAMFVAGIGVCLWNYLLVTHRAQS